MSDARLPAHISVAAKGDRRARDWCVRAVDSYTHATLAHGGPRYSGSRFDDVAASDPDRITPGDLLAVTMLDVAVPADAVIRFLGPAADHITSLLTDVRADVDLHEVDVKEVANSSKAGKLWTYLRAWNRPDPGTGPTTTSKLLARKRPRLLPIWDRVVGEQLGLRDHRDHWREVHELLQDRGLVELLSTTRSEARVDGLALLRVLDILLWMSDTLRYDGPEYSS
ncbi:DUF6308 family protein [Actinomycetospora sp. NBRC 106378]|uniref:DUF6308 family protein n=1 Tax=Actinomycetospora sp. NBRC 106378 TaxID=3032208 RepID=UPI0024A4E2AD|nr:DUF6308 family protein [Actinomycetospora sp. NBRC 106378]GLZ51707.1 hypothetical protein Acsp07_13240 [Actinomycetospora sp. NBRC 106378]